MVKRAAFVMFAYAVVLVGLGLLAYAIAPEGADPKTALIAGIGAAVLMIACGIATLLPSYGARMVGIHVGLLLPLAFAATFFWRGAIAYRESGKYQYITQVLLQQALRSGAVENTPEAIERFYVTQAYQAYLARLDAGAEPKTPETFAAEAELGQADVINYDKAYVARILFLLHSASVGAFVALLMLRPKPEERGATGKPELDLENEDNQTA